MLSSNKLQYEFLNIYTLLVEFLYAINIQKQKFHHLITLKIMAVSKILRRGKTFGGRPRGGSAGNV